MNSLAMQRRNSWLKLFLGLVLVCVSAGSAAAFPFTLGEVRGNLDTTLSYGLAWRMEDRDQDLIGLQEGGEAFSHNFDDGNLNYDEGELISNTAKITSELALDYRNFGLFVRGSAFYDFENYDGERERTELSDEALELVGRDAELLDAFVSWDFDLGDMLGQLRVGDQVLSWGESTFIQNGINVINPFDVSSLRVPGAELREALVPVGMVSASISPTYNVSFEGFYQYDWERVEIDPPGSYWSTNDFAGQGGEKVMLGFGDVHDQGVAPVEETLLGVPRAPNIFADNDGQFGIAMRVFAPALNDTEFGFYYMNYHSRLPVISSQTGSLDGLAAAGAMQNEITTAIVTEYAISGGTATLTELVTAGIIAGANAGVSISQIQAGAIAQTLQAVGGDTTNPAFARAVSAATTDAYAKTARYQVEYPEDIQLFGVSFNTTLQDSGVALQGEVSYRKDVPLQVDDLELLLATLEPLSIASQLGPTGAVPLDPTYSQMDTVTPAEILANGGNPVYIHGYERFDTSQVQMTATKLFGPTFGADQLTLIGEIGVTHVHGLPDKDDLRYDGPGTPVTGNPNHADPNYPLAAHPGKEEEPADAFADATSWGYRAVGKLDFNNALWGWDLAPRIAWAHDVNGTTPGPGGNFVDGRKAVTFGIGANYQQRWTADLSYTEYFGAGRYNLINDRDFLAFNVKYSF